MASSKPKVGDPAIIDGVPLIVLAVESGGRAKVDLGDENAAKRAERVAAVRAEYGPAGEALQAKFDAAVQAGIAEAEELSEKTGTTVQPKNFIKARTAAVKAELDMHMARLDAELSAIPRGVSAGVALKDLYWVGGSHEAWSVPGRFYPGAYASSGKFVRPSDPAELTEAAAAGR